MREPTVTYLACLDSGSTRCAREMSESERVEMTAQEMIEVDLADGSMATLH